MSSFSFTYPLGVSQNIQKAIDGIMALEGNNCILYFPGTPTPISGGYNINPALGSDISNNVWSAGMPLPFNNQANNTYEDASGYTEIEQTGSITMVVYPNPSKFNDIFPIGERKEDGLIITKGFTSDLDKILNCTRMETFIELGTNHYKYKLEGEPVIMGPLVKNRYFFALWSRL